MQILAKGGGAVAGPGASLAAKYVLEEGLESEAWSIVADVLKRAANKFEDKPFQSTHPCLTATTLVSLADLLSLGRLYLPLKESGSTDKDMVETAATAAGPSSFGHANSFRASNPSKPC